MFKFSSDTADVSGVYNLKPFFFPSSVWWSDFSPPEKHEHLKPWRKEEESSTTLCQLQSMRWQKILFILMRLFLYASVCSDFVFVSVEVCCSLWLRSTFQLLTDRSFIACWVSTSQPRRLLLRVRLHNWSRRARRGKVINIMSWCWRAIPDSNFYCRLENSMCISPSFADYLLRSRC